MKIQQVRHEHQLYCTLEKKQKGEDVHIKLQGILAEGWWAAGHHHGSRFLSKGGHKRGWTFQKAHATIWMHNQFRGQKVPTELNDVPEPARQQLPPGPSESLREPHSPCQVREGKQKPSSGPGQQGLTPARCLPKPRNCSKMYLPNK